MSLREKYGINPFGNRKPPPAPQMSAALSQIHRDYAELCSRINMNARDEWRVRGIGDFPALCAVPGIAEIGVNLETSRLHILTELIHARDEDGSWHTIGEIIVTYDALHKALTFENVTKPLLRGAGNETCAHPHILNGQICISTFDVLMQSFADAYISAAMERLMPALRMDRAVVGFNTAYLKLEHWPLKQEGI